jgi:hypothetical protein
VYIQARTPPEEWTVADLKKILVALSKTTPEMVLVLPLDQTLAQNLHRPKKE